MEKSEECGCSRKLNIEEIVTNKCMYTMLVIFTVVVRIVLTVVRASTFDTAHNFGSFYLHTNNMTVLWLINSMLSCFITMEICKMNIDKSTKNILFVGLVIQHFVYLFLTWLIYNNYLAVGFYISIVLFLITAAIYILIASVNKTCFYIYTFIVLFVLYNVYLTYKIK